MRDVLVKTLKLNESHKSQLDAQKVSITARDRKAIETLRESTAFKRLPVEERDRHNYRHILARITTEPVSYCESVARKIPALISEGLLDEDLNFSQTLTEGMGDVDSQNTQAKSQGMYGVGDGADKEEPSGDADSGTGQDGDHGDSSKTAGKGYLDEMDDVADPKHNTPNPGLADSKKGKKKDEDHYPDGKSYDTDKGMEEGGDSPSEFYDKKGETPWGDKAKKDKHADQPGDQSAKNEGTDVPKDAPSADSPDERAANDAAYKDGAKQNENVGEAEAGGSVSNHKPTAEDPGEPTSGTSGDKPETPDADTPDYSKVKAEDPSNWEGNKGPASAVNETFGEIEEKLVSMLESAGFEPGSDRWMELFQKGFSYAIEERARAVATRINEKATK